MTYKLTYFNFRGLAETIRFLLAYSEIDYEDVRLEAEQWPELKSSNLYNNTYFILRISVKLQNIFKILYLTQKRSNFFLNIFQVCKNLFLKCDSETHLDLRNSNLGRC